MEKRVVLALAPLLLVVSQAAQKPIVVGSKLDAEAQVLGQMIRLTLNDMGLATQDKTALGDTGVLRKAILSGEVDVYPEYTGNAFYLFPEAKISTAQASNKNTIYKLARDLDAKNGITWLVPANVNNTWVVAVTKALATRAKLVSVADLAKYVNGGGEFKIAGSPEYFNREDTFPMFEKVYGFQLRDNQKVVLAGATPTQTQQAASSGTNGVNGAMAYGTDATLGALNMVALTDPKGAQFVYQPSPIIRTATLRANPQISSRLNRVFATLNASTLIQLNGQIALQGRPATDVAAAYLKSKNLIK
jgi:osmoprotectant transport system substrate-binding protein